MVNQAEQPDTTQAPAPETGDSTTDITSEFEGVNTFEDTDTSPDVDTPVSEAPDTPAETPDTPVAPVAEAPPVQEPAPEPSPDMDELQRRLQTVEQQNQQYQQGQLQAQWQQQAAQVQHNLEQQGYLPDQAQQMTQSWMAQQNQAFQTQQNHQQELQYIQGQSNAAEHFATKYDLKMADLARLKQYDNPQSMEDAAKDIKSRRDLENELATLKAERVPSQSFDDSQSSPAASTDEDRWLERYNQGDRSTQAQSAARRAAGLG